MHAGGIFRLHADDAYPRIQRFHVGGNAADEPASTYSNEDGVDVVAGLLEDLHGDRALPRDHIRIVEGCTNTSCRSAASFMAYS